MSNMNQYREEQVATLLPSGEVSTKSTSTIPSPFSAHLPQGPETLLVSPHKRRCRQECWMRA